MREGYDIAQICLNGHVATSLAASSPEFQKPFCPKCGEPTIMACPDCRVSIQGHYHCPGVISLFDYNAPYYCHNCGKPFPWTTRAIEAARQLAHDDETLTKEESERFSEDIEEITRETAQAKASANRIKKTLGKLTAGTASAVRDIIVDIASESVKKMIFPS